jgi:hypothetical protein
MPEDNKHSELSVASALRRAALDSEGQSLQVVIRAAEAEMNLAINKEWASRSLLIDGFVINQDAAESVTWRAHLNLGRA